MHAVLAGDGLQRGELLERRLAQALVAADDVGVPVWLAVLVEVGCLDRDVLAVEATLGPRLRGALLAVEAEQRRCPRG